MRGTNKVRKIESYVMNMIPFGRLYVPFEFQHYNRYYTNRTACFFSILALLLIAAVIYHELSNLGLIQIIETERSNFLSVD